MAERGPQSGPPVERRNLSSYKTIGVLVIGESHYLYQEDSNGVPYAHAIDPNRDRLAFMQATRPLTPNHFHTFAGAFAPRVTLADLPATTAKVAWNERTGMIDEPTLTFPYTNATTGVLAEIQLYEQELADMFLKPAGDPTKAAAFFCGDTTSHELIGIALKRQFPFLMFVRPGRDGLALSPKVGLVALLDSIYDGLITNMSTLQSQVDAMVFDQFGPDGALKFSTPAGNAAQQRQQALLKTIYKIKALLLAGRAENNGKGLQDPDLLAHAPFVANIGKPKPNGGWLGKLGVERHSQPAQAVVPIGNELWTSIADKPHGGLIQTTGTQATYMPWQYNPPQPAPVRVVQQPARQVVQPPSQVIQPAQAPVPERRPAAPRISDMEKALNDGRELEAQIAHALKMFGQVRADKLDFGHVTELHDALVVQDTIARQLLKSHPRGALTASVTPTVIRPKIGTVDVAGIKDQYAVGYLTGIQATPWLQKIEGALAAWHQNAEPLFVHGHDTFNRSLMALGKPGTVRRERPDVAERVQDAMRAVLRNATGGPNANIVDTAVASHLLLSSQALFSLHQRFENLPKSGNVLEVSEWIFNAIGTYLKLRQLPVIAPAK